EPFDLVDCGFAHIGEHRLEHGALIEGRGSIGTCHAHSLTCTHREVERIRDSGDRESLVSLLWASCPAAFSSVDAHSLSRCDSPLGEWGHLPAASRLGDGSGAQTRALSNAPTRGFS